MALAITSARSPSMPSAGRRRSPGTVLSAILRERAAQSASAGHAPPASFLAVVACALASLNFSSPLPRTARQRPGAHSARDSPAAPLEWGANVSACPSCARPGPFSGGRVSADDGSLRDRAPSRPSAAAARTGPSGRRPPPSSCPTTRASAASTTSRGRSVQSGRPPGPGTTSGSLATRSCRCSAHRATSCSTCGRCLDQAVAAAVETVPTS